MDQLPLSVINDFLYCPRRAALKLIEGVRSENVHTARGDIVHEHADLAGYEVLNGVTLLRALPVFSERLGLSGKCDIVEVHPRCSNELSPMADGQFSPANGHEIRPVEVKLGKRREFENDDAQVCAQALCLEEMFQTRIARGAVFHAASKRRREIEFTAELRALTEKTIADLRAVFEAGVVPAAKFAPRCEECSLYEICLPRLTAQPRRLERAARELFQT
jgi:CRISPR-associated exonuclease Cas4